jgi:hypothetical protein
VLSDPVRAALDRARADGALVALIYRFRPASNERVLAAEKLRPLIGELLDRVQRRGFAAPSRKTPFANLGAALIEAPPDFHEALAAQPEIAAVMPNKKPGHPLEPIRPVRRGRAGKSAWTYPKPDRRKPSPKK